MDDVTDTVFRRIVADTAKPDLFFSEFVSVDGLMSRGRAAVQNKLQFTDGEKPLIAQLWGLKPDNYRAVADELATQGYAGIDINMGCPVPVVIKNGACSALINNRELAGQIIAATKEGADGRVPVSVKCRIGFNEIDLTWIEFLLEQGIATLTVHGRTTKEQSKVPNHWEVFEEIVALRDRIAPDTKIIGNGDVLSKQEGIEIAQRLGLDGIMIGRGIFKDPYAFADQSPWPEMTKDQKIDLYAQHIKLFIETWSGTKNPASLKKFAKVYLNGFIGASDARSAIMETNDATEMLACLKTL